MGARIRDELERAHPDVAVRVAHDTTRDPPDRDDVDVLVANTFPPGLLGRCARLRWLHLTGTGVDHVPAGAPRPGLVVTNSANVPARAVAEFAWMGLLAMARSGFRLVDQQRAREWQLPDSRLVAGSHLVLVGLGSIGAEIARRAAGFDVAVTAVTRRALPSPLARTVLPPERLAEALRTADHVVLAAPATSRTRHLVDGAAIRAMPASAALVNVGRPSLVDVDALVAALAEGRLRGALLDVHDPEPLPPESPLWDVRNLWISPHCAYRFPAEEQEIARTFAVNLTAFRGGSPLRNRVDVDAVLSDARAGVGRSSE
jgi:phosphoglycerate dehydrogenase-like enzyme